MKPIIRDPYKSSLERDYAARLKLALPRTGNDRFDLASQCAPRQPVKGQLDLVPDIDEGQSALREARDDPPRLGVTLRVSAITDNSLSID